MEESEELGKAYKRDDNKDADEKKSMEEMAMTSRDDEEDKPMEEMDEPMDEPGMEGPGGH